MDSGDTRSKERISFVPTEAQLREMEEVGERTRLLFMPGVAAALNPEQAAHLADEFLRTFFSPGMRVTTEIALASGMNDIYHPDNCHPEFSIYLQTMLDVAEGNESVKIIHGPHIAVFLRSMVLYAMAVRLLTEYSIPLRDFRDFHEISMPASRYALRVVKYIPDHTGIAQCNGLPISDRLMFLPVDIAWRCDGIQPFGWLHLTDQANACQVYNFAMGILQRVDQTTLDLVPVSSDQPAHPEANPIVTLVAFEDGIINRSAPA